MDVMRAETIYARQLAALYAMELAESRAWAMLAPRLADAGLRQAVLQNGQEAWRHMERLESLLLDVAGEARSRGVTAARGLLAEVLRISHRRGDVVVREAEVACAFQRLKYYQVGGYVCARLYARQLGYPEAAELLEMSLEEAQAMGRLIGDVAGRWMRSAA